MGNNLSTKGVLMKLSISQWSGRKFDRSVSDKVNKELNVEDGMGRYNKALIPLDLIKDIASIANKTRNMFYENTLPWGDNETRILPAMKISSVSADIRKFRAEMTTKVEMLIDSFPGLIEVAKVKLGTAFKSSDYPTPEELAGKYDFNVSIFPIPEVDDFRVALREDEIVEIKETLNKEMCTWKKGIEVDLWERLLTPVKHMADVLADPDKSFKNSLVDNIQTVADLIPDLNINENPNLVIIARKAVKELCKYTPDDLRPAGVVRQGMAQAAVRLAGEINHELNGLKEVESAAA